MHCLGYSQEVCSTRNCFGTLGINFSVKRLTLVDPSLIIKCMHIIFANFCFSDSLKPLEVQQKIKDGGVVDVLLCNPQQV